MSYFDLNRYEEDLVISEWLEKVNPIDLYERIFLVYDDDKNYRNKINVFKELVKADMEDELKLYEVNKIRYDEFKNNKADNELEHKHIKIIKELIEAGQLDSKPINDKYKPISKITDFLRWLYQNNYEEYINSNFIKKFIICDNTEKTIKQYMKPSMYSKEKKKRNKFVIV